MVTCVHHTLVWLIYTDLDGRSKQFSSREILLTEFTCFQLCFLFSMVLFSRMLFLQNSSTKLLPLPSKALSTYENLTFQDLNYVCQHGEGIKAEAAAQEQNSWSCPQANCGEEGAYAGMHHIKSCIPSQFSGPLLTLNEQDDDAEAASR